MYNSRKYINRIGSDHANRTKCQNCQYKSILCEVIFKTEKERYTATAHRPGDSMCWCCEHSIPTADGKRGCEWSLKRKPVEGWKADKHKHSDGTVSFNVRTCPSFKRRIPDYINIKELAKSVTGLNDYIYMEVVK